MISIKNFSKSFGKHKIIEDLNFEVADGEIFAFLGANGSGKTTTIRSLLNIYIPDSGELLVDGRIYDDSMSSIIGYLPEERGLYLESKALDILKLFGELRGMSGTEAKTAALNYLDEVGLADHAKQKVKSLSSGQQQKIQLGVALIGNPKLLILDEPTKGLDPVNRQLLMDMLTRLNAEQGTTILFSTHLMEMAEQIADKLIMIKNGERKLYGNVMEVRRSFGENVLQIEYSGDLQPEDNLYAITRHEKNYAELALNEDIELETVITHLFKQGLILTKFELTAPSLQEIFVKVQRDNA